MGRFVKVCEEEGDEPIELPLEDDGTLLFSTLSAQYPGTSGLKYHSESIFRGVRLADGKFHPPDNKWGHTIYYCVFSKENKRKSDDNTDNLVAKTKRMSLLKCTDLIVLGLPWELTEIRFRNYFETFGELLMAMIKKDQKTGKSKGYGFIRFSNYEVQVRVLAMKHKIDQRVVTVKIPISQEGSVPSSKIFVGRVTEDLSVDDLTNHFSKYGKVVDVFIPKPFRAFAFVTFLDAQVAHSLLGEDHIVKGVSVHIGEAAPKSTSSRASSTDGYSEGSSPPRYTTKKKEQWKKNDYHQPVNGSSPSGLVSALGMNPALIAALNQASWEWMGNMPPNNVPIPPQHMSGGYHQSLPNASSQPRPMFNGYPPSPYRNNWWGSGYQNPRTNMYSRECNIQYNTRHDRSGHHTYS